MSSISLFRLHVFVLLVFFLLLISSFHQIREIIKDSDFILIADSFDLLTCTQATVLEKRVGGHRTSGHVQSVASKELTPMV